MLGVLLTVCLSQPALDGHRIFRRSSTGEKGCGKAGKTLMEPSSLNHSEIPQPEPHQGEEKRKTQARHWAEHMPCNSWRGVSGARTPLG